MASEYTTYSVEYVDKNNKKHVRLINNCQTIRLDDSSWPSGLRTPWIHFDGVMILAHDMQVPSVGDTVEYTNENDETHTSRISNNLQSSFQIGWLGSDGKMRTVSTGPTGDKKIVILPRPTIH